MLNNDSIHGEKILRGKVRFVNNYLGQIRNQYLVSFKKKYIIISAEVEFRE